MPVEKKKGKQVIRKQSWLMLAEAEECNQYIPQFGDEVAYLRQVISHGQICYSFTPWFLDVYAFWL
jgi:hypothetical protein